MSFFQSYPIVWQGCLVLKNDSALVQMHYVSGAQHLIKRSMPDAEEGSSFAVLRISQRMRLENQQLEGVHRRMQVSLEARGRSESCHTRGWEEGSIHGTLGPWVPCDLAYPAHDVGT